MCPYKMSGENNTPPELHKTAKKKNGKKSSTEDVKLVGKIIS